MPRISVGRLLVAIMILAAMVVQGCSSSAPKQPVDKAEAIVDEFLDSWSRGESPDKFAGSSQPTQGADPDWKAGYRLLSFLTKETKPSQDTPNLVRCQVALSLQDRKGKKVEKEVAYDVQLGATNVISRAAH